MERSALSTSTWIDDDSRDKIAMYIPVDEHGKWLTLTILNLNTLCVFQSVGEVRAAFMATATRFLIAPTTDRGGCCTVIITLTTEAQERLHNLCPTPRAPLAIHRQTHDFFFVRFWIYWQRVTVPVAGHWS